MAKLAEEPQPCLVMGNLRGTEPDQVQVGMPVRMAFDDIPEEDITMWHFEASS
jgi:uncharacterized OB-fold protein